MWLLFLWAGVSAGASAGDAAFVGAERCQLCHRDAYQSWKLTPHARAGRLVDEAGEDERCLTCHGTSGGELPDVQCEACHGAGGNYWPADVMMDPEKAEMAGLVRPDEALCRSCHGTGEPGHEDDFRMPAPHERTGVIHRLSEP